MFGDDFSLTDNAADADDDTDTGISATQGPYAIASKDGGENKI